MSPALNCDGLRALAAGLRADDMRIPTIARCPQPAPHPRTVCGARAWVVLRDASTTPVLCLSVGMAPLRIFPRLIGMPVPVATFQFV